MQQHQKAEKGKKLKIKPHFICVRFLLQRNQIKKYARIHTFNEGHTFEFHCPLHIAF